MLVIPLPALQHHELVLVFSQDPALQLPDDVEQRDNVLRVARQTGRWDLITRAGQAPTIFKLRSLAGTAWTWVQSERLYSASRQRPLTDFEFAELALALALREVTNLGAFKVHFVLEAGFERADNATINALLNLDPRDPQLGRTLVLELATAVLDRATEGVPPL